MLSHFRTGQVCLLGTLLAVASCETAPAPVLGLLTPLPPSADIGGTATRRVDGQIGAIQSSLPVQSSNGTLADDSGAPGYGGTARGMSDSLGGTGEVSLDFEETDIRDVVAQILGTTLRANYTIDPAVHGTATLHTVRPLSQAQLLPALQSLLAQNGAALVRSGSLYRVVPTAGAGVSIGGVGVEETTGSSVVPLRYANADELAKVLQPFVANGGKIVAVPGRNTLLIDGEPGTRDTLLTLVQAFDTNTLAGQSYALLPVGTGSVKDFAAALQETMRAQSGGALAGVVRVVPMERANAVLVVSSQQHYVDEARRIFSLVERSRGQTVRTWHVVYLQNSHTNDVAYVLQRAFTPNDVSTQPSNSPGQTTQGQTALGQNASGLGMQTGSGGGGFGGGGIGQSGTPGGNGGFGGGFGSAGNGSGGGSSGGIQGTAGGLNTGGGPPPSTRSGGNPLMGGLDPTSSGGDINPDAMRIIPNVQNNAILVFATPRENDTVNSMIRKIDILPLQVRIDAVIAEVTLNDGLKYGTQFFFKSGGVNGILSNAAQNLGAASLSTAVLSTTLPGLVVGGAGLGGAPFVISALQAVTSVQVLSSPELMVLDNQPARLQVGNVVPYLSQSSQSTISANAPVVSSINYQQTGVIMQVTPRVNSGGLVTLDISQEVSDVDPNVTTPGLNSPTFQQRSVSSRVVVQDGQTIGLAGLIRDNVAKQNSGIPWLKDVPVLGFLAGQQINTRQRTELLILITPHVVHDQRDARALTEDLRDQLVNAAAVPRELQNSRPQGSADPGQRLRRQLQPQR